MKAYKTLINQGATGTPIFNIRHISCRKWTLAIDYFQTLQTLWATTQHIPSPTLYHYIDPITQPHTPSIEAIRRLNWEHQNKIKPMASGNYSTVRELWMRKPELSQSHQFVVLSRSMIHWHCSSFGSINTQSMLNSSSHMLNLHPILCQ